MSASGACAREQAPAKTPPLRYRLGVDIGGTFTDLVLLEPDGSITLGKIPSTPENQAIGVMAGVQRITGALQRIDLGFEH